MNSPAKNHRSTALLAEALLSAGDGVGTKSLVPIVLGESVSCGTTATCRCSKTKRLFRGLCDERADKRQQ